MIIITWCDHRTGQYVKQKATFSPATCPASPLLITTWSRDDLLSCHNSPLSRLSPDQLDIQQTHPRTHEATRATCGNVVFAPRRMFSPPVGDFTASVMVAGAAPGWDVFWLFYDVTLLGREEIGCTTSLVRKSENCHRYHFGHRVSSWIGIYSPDVWKLSRHTKTA